MAIYETKSGVIYPVQVLLTDSEGDEYWSDIGVNYPDEGRARKVLERRLEEDTRDHRLICRVTTITEIML